MAFRFTIGKKIGAGFGALIFFMIIVFYTTYTTLNSSIEINDNISEINNPSLASLEELKLLTIRSKMLIFIWADTKLTDHPDKDKLKLLIGHSYPKLKSKIATLSVNWSKKDINKVKNVFNDIHELFEIHQEVMATLPDFDSYDNTQNLFMADFHVGDNGDIHLKTSEILFQLDNLINSQKFQTLGKTSKMQHSFNSLKSLAKWLGIALLIGGLLIATYTTRSIVKPIDKLKTVLLTLSKGVFPKYAIKARKDEIGEMAEALNRLVLGLKSTKDFANAVGAGHFNTPYQPLSKNDSLGKALIKMRDDLAESERELEQKVTERTAELVKKGTEIKLQNEKISTLYAEVTDSIKYAKGIQEAILPPNEFINKVLPNSFILYKPKDIVSGDFYWVEEKDNKVYFAAVDCTGHGVPGAFMSILGYNVLNEALRKNNAPSAILDDLNKGISDTLSNNSIGTTTKDGMDLALCCYDKEKKQLQYAGAFNPLYILRNKKVQQVKADKFAIGTYSEDPSKKYTNHTLQLQENDQVYIFSDGYADQFGGPHGRKFMYRRFRDTLLKLEGKEINSQKEYLNKTIKDWKGSLQQIDDILVMGMHIL